MTQIPSVKITSSIPGRVRIAVDGLRKSGCYANNICKRLALAKGIKSVSANPLTGKALIYFDESILTDRQIVKLVGDTCLGIDLQRFSLHAQPAQVSFMPELIARDMMTPGNEVCYPGLNHHEASLRLKKYGSNVLAEPKSLTLRELLACQMKDFLVQVHVAVIALTFLLGRPGHALLTTLIVATNIGLGVWQERHAEQSARHLKSLVSPVARVLRAGVIRKMDARELVPGDTILLEAGDKVPADAKLVNSTGLEVEEAALTGENLPVLKSCCREPDDQLAIHSGNLVFMGTNVTRGRAQAIVTATGMKTKMGKISAMMQQVVEEQTPLQRRLEELGRYMVYGGMGLALTLLVVGVARGGRFSHVLLSAASLAVAIIPEGLNPIVIIAMAMGVRRINRRNGSVRKLASLETLGGVNVICCDKTGTLTKNEMTVRSIFSDGRFWQVSGAGYIPSGNIYLEGGTAGEGKNAGLHKTLLAGALCNNAELKGSLHKKREKSVSLEEWRNRKWFAHGDPVDIALLVAAAKGGLAYEQLRANYVRTQEVPFDSERRMMTVVCADTGDNKFVYAKGAVDTILERCSHQLLDGVPVLLDADGRRRIVEANDRLTRGALRVIAVACQKVDCSQVENTSQLEENLIFCGLAGMTDPPRPEAVAAIEKCRKAGIKVVMITGDHPNTARAVARELKLTVGEPQLILGNQVDEMSDTSLADHIRHTDIFARTMPQHKLRIVKALKQQGFIVAMTGDGVNDAPALRESNVGIAMGITGTEVAKDAAGLVLIDDNFATIVSAVEEGRSIYANIRKAVRYLIAANIGEAILMLAAVIGGLPAPLLPLQLLLLNLVGDGLPAVTLVNDPPSEGIMDTRPRDAKETIFAGRLGQKIITRGLILGAFSTMLYVWKFNRHGVVPARTLVFVHLAVSQLLYIFDCRREEQTGKARLWSNIPLLCSVALSSAIIIGATYIPLLRSLFGTVPLTRLEWITAVGPALLTIPADRAITQIAARNMKKP